MTHRFSTGHIFIKERLPGGQGFDGHSAVLRQGIIRYILQRCLCFGQRESWVDIY